MTQTYDTQDATPSYAGDITPQQAHDWQQQGQGVVIDVRTRAELDWLCAGQRAAGLERVPGDGGQPRF